MSSPIGVFDSGVGGLAVLQRIHTRLPDVDTAYVADQAFAPYGPRTSDDITDRARAVTRLLAEAGAQLIVVACNTATAAAIDTLRHEFPDLQFVGMEPAVKPAAAMTETGVIGVLATEGTLSADRYRSLAANYSAGIEIVHRIGDGLAMDVERGRENDPATRAKLHEHADAFVGAGADVVVLGCTHYSFLAPHLTKEAGKRFLVVDPADAVSKQVERLAEHVSYTGSRTYATTDPESDPGRIRDLVGEDTLVDLVSVPVE